jgi:hypothetical protein
VPAWRIILRAFSVCGRYNDPTLLSTLCWLFRITYWKLIVAARRLNRFEIGLLWRVFDWRHIRAGRLRLRGLAGTKWCWLLGHDLFLVANILMAIRLGEKQGDLPPGNDGSPTGSRILPGLALPKPSASPLCGVYQ